MRSTIHRLFVLSIVFFAIGSNILAQESHPKSQEVSDVDGQPVLLKHLPDYERAQSQAQFATDKATLQNAAGTYAILDLIDFSVGTEAVTAPYPEGRLAIVEFTNPQSSAEADAKIQQYLVTQPQPSIVYRRIGNYNAFVFGVHDVTAANALLDRVKYEKSVQWLGEDPYLLKKVERYLVTTSRDIVLSTVTVILLGLGGSLVMGILVGLLFFRVRDQRRAGRVAFSDAGGLTRLNLDGLTEQTSKYIS